MTARRDCEICRGAGFVRLPRYRRAVAAVMVDAPGLTVEAAHRDFPCPECADTVPFERIAVVNLHVELCDGAPIELAHGEIAHGLARHMQEQRFITFRRGHLDPYRLTRPVRGTVGVVAPSVVATLEQRLAADRHAFSEAVGAEVRRQIENWNSQTGYSGWISKSQILDSVRDALAAVLARRQP